MMSKRLILAGLLAAVLLVTLVSPALAQDSANGKLIFGQDFTLRNGQVMRGDLGLLGGSATVEEGAQILGDVLVAGGYLNLAGAVHGDVAVFGGTVRLAPSAVVDGEVATFGGQVSREPGAVVTGGIHQGFEFRVAPLDNLPFRPGITGRLEGTPGSAREATVGSWLLSLLLALLRTGAIIVGLSLLALLTALIWPERLRQVGRTAEQQPFLAFAVGLAIWIVAIGLGILMLITLCLAPFALLLFLCLVLLAILAWITLGWILGRRLLAALRVDSASRALEATVGTALLLLVYFLVGILPCLDFIFGMVVASVGLGALVLTRFGTQDYQPGGPRQPAPTQPPSPPEALLAAPQAMEPEPPAIRSGAELGLPPSAEAIAQQVTADRPAIQGSAGQARPAVSPEGADEQPESGPQHSLQVETVAGEVDAGLPQLPMETAPDLEAGEALPTVELSRTVLVAEMPSAPARAQELFGGVTAEGDDLELIVGIGPVFAGRLQAAGISTFAALAQATPEQLSALIDVAEVRIRREDWISQARQLVA